MFSRSGSSRRRRSGKQRARLPSPADEKVDTRLKTLSDEVRMLTQCTLLNPVPSIMDIPKMVISPQRTFTVKQNNFYANLTTTATGTFGAVTLTLNSFANGANLAAVFDSWRILQATVRFVPQVKPGTGVSAGPLLTAIDYDDVLVPTATGQLREYDSLYEVPWGNYVERTFTPAAATAVYSGAFTSFAKYRGWCDVASPNIQWYGVKWATDSGTVINNAYVIEVEAVLQFQNVR